MKYTKPVLEAAVKESISVAEVLRKLRLSEAGGIHSHISRRIKQLGIDTAHFLGQRANSKHHRNFPTKLPWKAILQLRSNGHRQRAFILRRALLEAGRPYRCSGPGCQVEGQWLGQPLMLHVNHKNRNWLDNRLDNLEFLCPNCHAQTEGYCGSKGLAEIDSVALQSRVYRARRKAR